MTMEASIAEEEYIDMDVSSSAALTLPSSPPSPPQSRDFEFQMSGKPLPEMDCITSPADELFCNGKLLPLHLHKLLHDSIPTHSTESVANATATPYESCYASPAASCYASGELDPESYFADECQADTEPPPTQQQLRAGGSKSWTKKLGLIKKASRAYLKSLFTRSGCSDESCSGGRLAKKAVGRADAEKVAAEGGRGHRRSFSGAIKRRASNKSSSTSTSSSSNSSSFSSVSSNSNNGPYGPQGPRRSSSGSSEVECSIQGAIAYCKKSQQEEARAGKSATDVEFYAAAVSASRIAADCEKKQERPEICRG